MTKQWLIRRDVRRPSFALDDRGHQLVGVEAALHQRLGAALEHELDRLVGGSVAVLDIDDRVGGDVDIGLLRRLLDLLPGADEDGRDETEARGADGAVDRRRVARMDDRRRHRRQALAGVEQTLILRMLVHACLAVFFGTTVSRGFRDAGATSMCSWMRAAIVRCFALTRSAGMRGSVSSRSSTIRKRSRSSADARSVGSVASACSGS
jgi:hypothetical protein